MNSKTEWTLPRNRSQQRLSSGSTRRACCLRHPRNCRAPCQTPFLKTERKLCFTNLEAHHHRDPPSPSPPCSPDRQCCAPRGRPLPSVPSWARLAPLPPRPRPTRSSLPSPSSASMAPMPLLWYAALPHMSTYRPPLVPLPPSSLPAELAVTIPQTLKAARGGLFPLSIGLEKEAQPG